eukprot:SAG31_NODE_11724_length_1003_cov_1.109513_1_plen_72_part_10
MRLRYAWLASVTLLSRRADLSMWSTPEESARLRTSNHHTELIGVTRDLQQCDDTSMAGGACIQKSASSTQTI